MSDNCCTFAPEIGKGHDNNLLRQSREGNAGVRPLRNSRSKNTYRECAEKKMGALPISGSHLFRFYSMKPTYILFWEIIFETLRTLIRRLLTIVYKI